MTDPTDATAREVLVVCVHNAGRSQMAAALLTHHAGNRIVVRSAGTAPAHTINPAVVARWPRSASTSTPTAQPRRSSPTPPSKRPTS